MHYHLVFEDVKVFEFLLASYFQNFPGDVVDITRLFINEVMMSADFGIKYSSPFLNCLRFERSLFNQQV